MRISDQVPSAAPESSRPVEAFFCWYNLFHRILLQSYWNNLVTINNVINQKT